MAVADGSDPLRLCHNVRARTAPAPQNSCCTAPEIDRLAGKVRQKGYTLIPLSLYLKSGRVKVEIGLAMGKKDWDNRESIKRKQERRDLAAAGLKNRA